MALHGVPDRTDLPRFITDHVTRQLRDVARSTACLRNRRDQVGKSLLHLRLKAAVARDSLLGIDADLAGRDDDAKGRPLGNDDLREQSAPVRQHRRIEVRQFHWTPAATLAAMSFQDWLAAVGLQSI